ncbi:MAG: SDR family NAD(P)-dependent oxidoreductase [Fusobacteria bacterium]|nr:SDR family NAD(P)-dependent oxidoreductase [Fusobacteriota bacterium]
MMKTVLITGATSGIGKATALLLAKSNYRVIAWGRDQEKLELLAQELSHGTSDFMVKKVDVCDASLVEQTIKTLIEQSIRIDFLINNAGLAKGLQKLHTQPLKHFDEVFDTNVKGLLYVTKFIVEDMVKRDQGHIINIGSIAGIHAYSNGALYCASKSAVATLSDGLRQDLVDKNIKVTNIQPGLVETPFSEVRFLGDSVRAKSVYQGIESLKPEDIASTILYAMQTPPHVQIAEINIMPTHQATGGVIYKK